MTPVTLPSIIDLCSRLNLYPRTCIEIGAAHPESYRLRDLAIDGANIILVEANPRLAYCLVHGYDPSSDNFRKSWPAIPPPPHERRGLSHFRNVRVINAAIVDVAGPIKLYERNASSFVGGVTSPAKINDGYAESDTDAFDIPGITIDTIDDGTVDVLLADCEGSEWFCLKHLKTRPKVIVLETHGGEQYTNPYLNEITEWLRERNYALAGYDLSDSLFVRRD